LLNFFGQKTAAKNEKRTFFYFFKQKHRNHFVHQDKVSEVRFLLIVGWGESCKAIANETLLSTM